MPVQSGGAGRGLIPLLGTVQGLEKGYAEERGRRVEDRMFDEAQRQTDLQMQMQMQQMIERAREFDLTQEQQRELAEYEAKLNQGLQARQQGFQREETRKQRESVEKMHAEDVKTQRYGIRTQLANIDRQAALERQQAQESANVYNYLRRDEFLRNPRNQYDLLVELDGADRWIDQNTYEQLNAQMSQNQLGAERIQIKDRRMNAVWAERRQNLVNMLGGQQRDPMLPSLTPEELKGRERLADDWIQNFDTYQERVLKDTRDIMIAQNVAKGGGAGGAVNNLTLQADGSYDVSSIYDYWASKPEEQPLKQTMVTRQIGDEETGYKALNYYLPSYAEEQLFFLRNEDAQSNLIEIGHYLGKMNSLVQEGINEEMFQGYDAEGNMLVAPQLEVSMQEMEQYHRMAIAEANHAFNQRKFGAPSYESVVDQINQTFKYHSDTLRFGIDILALDEQAKFGGGDVTGGGYLAAQEQLQKQKLLNTEDTEVYEQDRSSSVILGGIDALVTSREMLPENRGITDKFAQQAFYKYGVR